MPSDFVPLPSVLSSPLFIFLDLHTRNATLPGNNKGGVVEPTKAFSHAARGSNPALPGGGEPSSNLNHVDDEVVPRSPRGPGIHLD